MSDGVRCPNLHDGMAVVDDWREGTCAAEGDGATAERRRPRDDTDRSRASRSCWCATTKEASARPTSTIGPTSPTAARRRDRQWRHDQPGIRHAARAGGSPSWSSLAGTIRNCAGGVTPWGSWLTCEETDDAGPRLGLRRGLPQGQHHAARRDGPLLARGADGGPARRAVVYETEDAGNCGLYRFVPYRTGHLDQGGRLYMLAISGRPNLDLGAGLPDRHDRWTSCGCRSTIRWRSTQSCYAQGAAQGGARFSRLEGAWWGDRTGYFLSTNGGSAGEGQVFEYDPRDETLTRHLRRAEREQRRQPGQHHRDAARRPAALRGRGRQQLHRRRAAGRPDRCTARRSPSR